MAIFLNKVKLNYSTLKKMQEIVFQGRLQKAVYLLQPKKKQP